MGRKLINKETYLQPAEYADGFVSADVSVTFTPRRRRDGDDGEDWARTAALRVYDSLADDFGETIRTTVHKNGMETGGTECSVTAQRNADGSVSHLWAVRLVTGRQDETDWYEDFWSDMEDFWDEDGGVTDEGAAKAAFRKSVERLVRVILCEDEETARDDNFSVTMNNFTAWQGVR